MGTWVQEFLNVDVRYLLIGAVILLGVLVFVFLTLGLKSKRRARQAEFDAEQNAKKQAAIDRGEDDQPIDNDVMSLMRAESGDAILTTGVPEAGLAETIITAPPPQENLTPDNLGNEATVLHDIRRLEQQGESVDLAKLYTERASLALEARDTPVAQEYFLKGLSMAGLVSAPEQQAFARMKLGDISHADGDLTTACEHWQLARDLYRECGEIDMASQVEEKMDENQCPTDWVLNQF